MYGYVYKKKLVHQAINKFDCFYFTKTPTLKQLTYLY